MGYKLFDKSGNELNHHNLQDKDYWCGDGERIEHSFVRQYGNALGLKINPQKEHDKYAPDLINAEGQLCDLKTQNTPFFSSARYGFNDPSYVVVFNKKDARRYYDAYRNIDIYFWVRWEAVKYINDNVSIEVEPIEGVWKVSFINLIEILKNAPIHHYKQRINDIKGNAKSSFLISIKEKNIIKVQ
ncbi:MAG: hypothetical protein AAF391_01765 [Bacteroidota bacterium]